MFQMAHPSLQVRSVPATPGRLSRQAMSDPA
jgi:hypothetical protein